MELNNLVHDLEYAAYRAKLSDKMSVLFENQKALESNSIFPPH
jgi:hypothetical protein